MLKNDALKILKIMSQADGGCTACVRSLYRDFFKAFPEIIPTLDLMRKAMEDSINNTDEEAREMLEDLQS